MFSGQWSAKTAKATACVAVLLLASYGFSQQASNTLSPDAQAAAMAAQLAIQQQQAAMQQQLQQQVEEGRQQAGKNVATTVPKTTKSTVEELNKRACAKNAGPDAESMAVACNPGEKQAAENATKRVLIVPEPGSEMAPPQGVSVSEKKTNSAPGSVAAAVTVARPRAAAVQTADAAPSAIAAPAGGAIHIATGVATEIQPAPMVIALPLSSLPKPPELASATRLPSPGLSNLREHLKKIAGKYDVSKIGDRGVGSGLDFYSLQKEEMLGKELAADVERDSRQITDPVIVEYVNRVGQNLVRNSDAKVPFVIKVLDNDEVNAFALPGGFFYVNSGLIMAADNEAQLAGVMAHEIAHVAARHATKSDTRAQIFNLASVPLIFVGGPLGYIVRQAVGLAMPMSYLKFSRDMEREADLLGLEYQYATGYDPQEFVRFFETIKAKEKQKQSFLAKAFATHPMTGDRIKRAQSEIIQYLPPKQDYIVDTSEFDTVKARLAAITHQQRLDEATDPNQPTLRRRKAGNSF